MDTAEDGKKGKRPTLSLSDVPCTCSGGRSERATDHHSLCHRGRFLRQREKAAPVRTENNRAIENRQ